MSDSARIHAYLLGSLAPEEVEQIEQQILTDDSFHEEVEIMEEELLDRYAQGSMAGEERLRLEQHFLTSPLRKQRLNFARALQNKIDSGKRHPALIPARVPTAYRYTFAGCACALIVLSVVTYRLSVQLQQQRSQTASLSRQIEEMRQTGSSTAAHPDLAFQPLQVVKLSPGVTRETNLPKIVIPEGIKAVQFALQVPKTFKDDASVDLLNDSGQVVLTFPPIHPAQVANDNEIIVTLLREHLRTGNYFLQLRPTQSSSTLLRYSLQIVN
jgi:anti-sigma-K factor RskA